MAVRHAQKHGSRNLKRQTGKTLPKKISASKGFVGSKAKAAHSVKAAKRRSPRPKPAVPRPRLAEAIPDEAGIQELLDNLNPADRNTVTTLLQSLQEHLGSAEAVRVWLATKAPEFGVTPLEAIRAGKARVVQAVLESRWGLSPIYG